MIYQQLRQLRAILDVAFLYTSVTQSVEVWGEIWGPCEVQCGFMFRLAHLMAPI